MSYLNLNGDRDQISQIMKLALSIFENAGIKRKIDNVSKFQSQVIYFEIAKLIFPQIMSELIELSENKDLTAEQKIQGLVNIIEEIVRVNLDHIEGSQIVKGHRKHIKHFLELLQALSQKIFNSQNQVSDGGDEQYEEDQQEYNEQQADIDQNKDHSQQQSLQIIKKEQKFTEKFRENSVQNKNEKFKDYPLKKQGYQFKNKSTNIGTQKQKQKQKERQAITKHDFINSQKPDEQLSSNHHPKSSSQSSGYLIPPVNYPDSKRTQKKNQLVQPKKNKPKKVKFQVGSTPKQKPSIKPKIYIKTQGNKDWQYPQSIKKQIQNTSLKIKASFIKNNFATMEDLDQNRLINQSKEFKKWANKQNHMQNQIVQNINCQFVQRQALIKLNLQQRSKLIKATTQNSDQYIRAMKNLFTQQKSIIKNIKKKTQEKQLQAIKNMIKGFKKEEKVLQNQILQNITSKKNSFQKRPKKIRV